MTYRKQPKSPMERYSIRDFERDFPTDEACLEWLRDYLYPDGIFCKRCDAVTKHHRVKSRPSYSCDRCGRHEHPTAGTIFHGSRTPLRLWFRAIFLMAQTRCGISAKAIERDLGVTYKTAWRMFHQIRALLDEGVTDLDGAVEIDETYIGGKPRRHTSNRSQAQHEWKARKIQVQGFVERGGRVKAMVNPPSPLAGNVVEHVLPSAMVFSDEAAHYTKLYASGYTHIGASTMRRRSTCSVTSTPTPSRASGRW